MRMRNWADLSEDLLNLILSNLFGKDRRTFGLICRSWNAVASVSPYRYSPCLMYYNRRNHMWKFHQYNSFFYMGLCDLQNAEIRCSKYGWLLMSRYDNSLFFFDPFNNQKIELPCELRPDYTTLCFFHLPTSTDCLVVGISTPNCTDKNNKYVVKIALLKHGEHQWEISKRRFPESRRFMLSSATPILHRGLLYFLDVKGNVATFNLNERDCKRRVVVKFRCLRRRRLGRKIKDIFLFRINGEECLFAVFLIHEERKVNLFRLLEPEKKWESVKDIGEKVLYLSHASSFGDMAYAPSMSNRIYFPTFHGDHSAVFYSLSSEKYHSLAGDYTNSGKYQPLAGDYSDKNAYGIKRLDFATWITPAPTPEFTTKLTWYYGWSLKHYFRGLKLKLNFFERAKVLKSIISNILVHKKWSFLKKLLGATAP